MTFVPASDTEDFGALVGAVTVLLGSLQWITHRENADPGKIVAQCADGTVIGAREHGVRRRPGRGARRRLFHRTHGPRVREDLQRGDLAWARLREGRAGEAPWIVEGIDDDAAPYVLHWEFATVEAALAAHRLIEERIVEPPRDATGATVPLDDAAFDARLLARARVAEA